MQRVWRRPGSPSNQRLGQLHQPGRPTHKTATDNHKDINLTPRQRSSSRQARSRARQEDNPKVSTFLLFSSLPTQPSLPHPRHALIRLSSLLHGSMHLPLHAQIHVKTSLYAARGSLWEHHTLAASLELHTFSYLSLDLLSLPRLRLSLSTPFPHSRLFITVLLHRERRC